MLPSSVPGSQRSSVIMPPSDSIVSVIESKKHLFGTRFNKDTINESTKDGYNSSMNRMRTGTVPDQVAETTGWHFAT